MDGTSCYLLAASHACISPQSVLQARQQPGIFIRLNGLCQKLTVPEQGIGRDWCRYILHRFFISDMDGLERNTVMFLRHLLHPWYPIIGVGTLIGVIQNKTVIFNRRMLRAFPELFGICADGSMGRYMRLIPQSDMSATRNPL